ncbi:unnamed protein product [Coregonus sp. 'balchen']|nr:unnamed protein product [Coregonus sp. 'balchen']
MFLFQRYFGTILYTVQLAIEFKTWVEVSMERLETVERLETLRALEQPDVFTTEPGAGRRIRTVDQSEIPLHQPNNSSGEQEDFISALWPTSLVPIVGSPTSGIPSFFALLPRRKRHEVLVPELVQHYMKGWPELQVQVTDPSQGSRPGSVMEEACETGSMEQPGQEEEMDTEMVADRDGEESDCILMGLSIDPSPTTDPSTSPYLTRDSRDPNSSPSLTRDSRDPNPSPSPSLTRDPNLRPSLTRDSRDPNPSPNLTRDSRDPAPA